MNDILNEVVKVLTYFMSMKNSNKMPNEWKSIKIFRDLMEKNLIKRATNHETSTGDENTLKAYMMARHVHTRHELNTRFRWHNRDRHTKSDKNFVTLGILILLNVHKLNYATAQKDANCNVMWLSGGGHLEKIIISRRFIGSFMKLWR